MNGPPTPSRRFCVAPMMERTDRHCRYLMRLLTRRAMLYTEMVVDRALLRNTERFLAHDAFERPVGFQVGGNEPDALGACAGEIERGGYDEVNLNVGCPSGRAQSGRIGACLMAEPARVADCVRAMRARTRLPVTVKCRTGLGDGKEYDTLARFVETVGDAGCVTFLVHARNALLKESTRRNLRVPPLRHDDVRRLKRDFPDLEFVLNGGLHSLNDAKRAIDGVDGVMMGRAAYSDMWQLAGVDAAFYAESAGATASRTRVLRLYLNYISREVDKVPLHRLIRPLGGLIRNAPGASRLRRDLFAIARSPEPVRHVSDWFSRFTRVMEEDYAMGSV